MDAIKDIHNKVNKIMLPKFPQVKNINITYEHQTGLWSPSTLRYCSNIEDGILVFDVQFDDNMKFIPNLLSNIGNTIFLLVKMIYTNDLIKIRVNFNSMISQSSFINY